MYCMSAPAQTPHILAPNIFLSRHVHLKLVSILPISICLLLFDLESWKYTSYTNQIHINKTYAELEQGRQHFILNGL